MVIARRLDACVHLGANCRVCAKQVRASIDMVGAISASGHKIIGARDLTSALDCVRLAPHVRSR